MLHFGLATEDQLSEAVGIRLLAETNYPIAIDPLVRKNGNGYLRSNLKRWCELALRQPFILITDLDNAQCPSMLMKDWFGDRERPGNLIFRVAVREVESWLLADHQAMRALLGEKTKLPVKPDNLDDPKRHLLDLAKKASREVRLDLVKASGAASSQGLGYNARLTDFVANMWSPQRAAERSPSLSKAILRLSELGQRCG